MKAIFFTDNSRRLENVFNDQHISKLEKICPQIDKNVFDKKFVLDNAALFQDTEYIFSTWGIQPLTEEEIRCCFPKLKCLFHAAGSVQAFGRAYLNCGVRVFSAWAANAVPVAEYTVAQVILANKGFFATTKVMDTENYGASCSLFRKYPGNYQTKIGIIGAGMIGKLVIRMLKAYRVEVLVYDPFLPDEVADELEIQKVSLEELFAQCNVISNHLANNEQTQNLLDYRFFSSMKPYATFLNTGRGAQVVETDLIRALEERPDITAVLDVTNPEPPLAQSKLYDLDNCVLTPHIAGSSGNEFWRIADYIIEEFERYLKGEPCKYEVTMQMLETMA